MPPAHLSTNPALSNRIFNLESNKRKSARRFVNDLAQINFGNQMVGCLVHNLSDEGAMIEVSTSQVPDRFILKNFRTKKRVICEVVWRDHLRFGVKFSTIPKPFSDGFA